MLQPSVRTLLRTFEFLVPFSPPKSHTPLVRNVDVFPPSLLHLPLNRRGSQAIGRRLVDPSHFEENNKKETRVTISVNGSIRIRATDAENPKAKVDAASLGFLAKLGIYPHGFWLHDSRSLGIKALIRAVRHLVMNDEMQKPIGKSIVVETGANSARGADTLDDGKRSGLFCQSVPPSPHNSYLLVLKEINPVPVQLYLFDFITIFPACSDTQLDAPFKR
ncbi:hypothetical protein BDN72DRAFT_853220 [Pluteus cervinus]|uniref:Uncharacterized protein n=1 Tax=Pluteus cervinus TaxID=181527 RepID=A0ACD3BCY9_9AGAR|nr:hypothetical protein BDN72DRAFT_853220 [Pluteus cervinus]